MALDELPNMGLSYYMSIQFPLLLISMDDSYGEHRNWFILKQMAISGLRQLFISLLLRILLLRFIDQGLILLLLIDLI